MDDGCGARRRLGGALGRRARDGTSSGGARAGVGARDGDDDDDDEVDGVEGEGEGDGGEDDDVEGEGALRATVGVCDARGA